MKYLKLKKSLLVTSICALFLCFTAFQCTSTKKSGKPVVVNPQEVVDTLKNGNVISPNHSENQAKVDSIKKAQLKKKKTDGGKKGKKNR